ncbi:M56 family metallopeptidase [Flagellimonas sp. HSM57]|uniref:M56 family metallopeptidase n=2 Tax=unclassified Flagellimonas TaxID=2644544 RepID=UPI0013D0C0AF|nr:M56 family metallopeptidase [Flagellimonas sp. HSM57]
MLAYLVKSGACMAILLFFYKLLLERENMHVFKRFYLLGALVFSLIVPSIVFVEYVEPITASIAVQPLNDMATYVEAPLPNDMDTINWSLVWWSLYGIGLLGFVFRFFRNLFQILNRISNNPKVKQHFTINVLLLEKFTPHTFFNYIFLNKLDFESKAIPDEVLLHEAIHAKQKHSIDVLFIEILNVLFWFNPLLYFYKKSIKLNHEFLADSAVLKQKGSTNEYQNTLLSYLSNDSLSKYQSVKMANAINYSSIKKRFVIMKKNTSKSSILLRSTLVLPLLTLLLYGFSEKKTIALPNMDEEIILGTQHNSEKTSKRFDIKGQTVGFSNQKSQQSASREQMAEYNKLAKKYNTMPKDNMHIKTKEVDRLKYIYRIMSDKQREDAEPFPEFPEPPSPPMAPDHVDVEEEFVGNHIQESIKNQETYSVVVKDGETITETVMQQTTSMASNAQKEELEAALKQQELALKEQEKALEEQELAMKEHEKAMRAHEKALKEQEIAIRAHEKAMEPPMPPLPPEPKTPLKHATEMAEQGAIFFYKGKKVTSDEAIKILKKEKNLSISIEKTDNKTPIVKIDTHF